MRPNRPEDFWRFVELIPFCTCWIWVGSRSGRCYGAFNLGGVKAKAHRFSYEIAYGPIPHGMHVLHHCDYGFCVRPAHLFLGTHVDNMADMDAKGRRVIPRGEEQGSAVLTEPKVIALRADYARGLTQVQLASIYGVTQTHVSRIVNRQSWSHI